METNISVMRHRLSELKGQIINGCRNILTDFRERGTVALNGITQFLHVRPVLESIQSAAEKSMQASNRAVARIDAFSTEYHEMGRHLKNMGRAIQGKPAETDAKENGKVRTVRRLFPCVSEYVAGGGNGLADRFMRCSHYAAGSLS